MGDIHDWEHRKARAEVARWLTSSTRCVLCGELRCPRTGQLMVEQRWNLAHDDERPGIYLGPAHEHCNKSQWPNSPRSKRGKKKPMADRAVVVSGERLRRVAPGRGEV